MRTALSTLANCSQATKECTPEWKDRHTETIEEIAAKFLPHGSGIDSGCKVNIQESGLHKIVIEMSYHHMNDDGYYDGWTDHKIIATPTFLGVDIKITGRDRNGIKDYLADLFDTVFEEMKNTPTQED